MKLPGFAVCLCLLLTAAARGQSALDGFDPNANSYVTVVVVQADGKVLIGGDFTTVSPNGGAAVTRNHIARLNPDGTLDTAFDPSASGIVYSIAVQADGKILVGGNFDAIGGKIRNHVARLDATTGLADSFNPNANHEVRSIALQADGKILVGGAFTCDFDQCPSGTTSIGGQSRNNIARLDPITGLADSFDPNASASVRSLAVESDGKILVSGNFNTIGGQPRNYIARLDAATGLADSFDPNADTLVLSIAEQADNKILVGGFFTHIGGQPRNYIARLDAATGLADSFDPNANGTVASIRVQLNGKILTAGGFLSIGGQTRNHIARLDAITGLADSFNPKANDFVWSVAIATDSKILAGGNFTTLAPDGGALVTRNRVARMGTATATPTATPTPTPTATPSGCTNSLGVTRLSQGDPRWGANPYDHIPYNIKAKGCALTSLTMAMNFAGLSGVTPGTLNDAANALPNGYTDGGVNWGPITSTGNLGFSATRLNSVASNQAAKDYLDQVLCGLGRPVIVGVFKNPTTGIACNDVCHFVLVTGKQSDGRYLIADPGNSSHTTLDAYDNHFETRGSVVSSAKQPTLSSPTTVTSSTVQQVSVSGSGGVGLLVIDPAGHATGINPVSGARAEEIPNSAHFVDSISDDETGESAAVTQSVYVEQPAIGRYEIRVTPSADGPFRISASTLSSDGVHTTPLFVDGVGLQGQTRVYYVSVNNAHLGNIATRLRVAAADNTLIGGFIITGAQPKKVIVRGLGPSLANFGLSGVLADPILELHDSSQLIATNDDWQSNANKQEIVDQAVAPTNAKEAAILTTLSPGAYTAILRGTSNTTGIGTVEVYELDQTGSSRLANISTRGFVDTGDNVMIGGAIITGATTANVLVRAIGPSLTGFGVPNALPDPTLELHDGNGGVIGYNDNWRSDQEAEISATTIPPTDNRESAILRTLIPGAYTAIVRGAGNTTGVALVEAYQLP
jgi:uncharacterized delta-60 repeat protein